MEHNEIQWSGAPSCQRGTFSFYKSVSSRSGTDGPLKVWRLGEFYFIRCGPQDPVCVAEVTLLWEDQTQRHLLASARLYFLPEDTPRGRTREHGEDEVLAVSRKMVVRVEDLVKWSCLKPSSWIRSQKQLPLSCETNSVHKPPQNTDTDGSNNNNNNNNNVSTENDSPVQQNVKVLSYPQYCRFRSLQRRVQDAARGPGLQDPHLLALGGVKALPNTRLLYCRDTFNHPTLESSTVFSWQFRSPSLSLRGRPRKRRGHDGKDSPTFSQSESWIEKMKENVMGSVELGGENSWLPHPEEQLFLDQLYTFMDQQGSPIIKVPNLGFKKIDLFLMFSVVRRLGGYKKVTTERLWKCVYNELGGCPGSTSAATCTRKHYERLILPYEEHLRTGGTEFKIPQSPSPPKPRGIRGRKPLPRGRKPGPKPKEKISSSSCSSCSSTALITYTESFPQTMVNPDAPVVVKRGRGRPPGTRNKTTLLAEAKLLTQQSTKVPQTPGLLIPPKGGGGGGGGGARPSSTHRPPVLTVNLPLTPDLSPMSTSFLPFPLNPKELKPERAESTVSPPGVILSTLPPHIVGGSLGGFSPIKGICPLDVFRNRFNLQRAPESPAVTPQDPALRRPSIYTSAPDAPHQSGEQLQAPPSGPQQHGRASGFSVDEVAQVSVGCRDARLRPPLPPLRVLPLNLDCSVQVCQLMKSRRLDPSQLQTFTRRLSEALSQDLSPKPPCSPMTPPPEQALPLNLSKRFVVKRPSTEGLELFPVQSNGNVDLLQQAFSKRPRPGVENSGDFHQGAKSSSSTGSAAEEDVEMKNPEEPADLSSPSRIRAFLLGLPPFQVKLEEDLNGTRFGKFHPAGSDSNVEQPEGGAAAVKKDVMSTEEAVEKNNVQQAESEYSSSAHCAGPGPVATPSKSNAHCF